MSKLPVVSLETIMECHNEIINDSSDREPFERMRRDNPILAVFLEGAIKARNISPMIMFTVAVAMYDALDRQAEKDILKELYK